MQSDNQGNQTPSAAPLVSESFRLEAVDANGLHVATRNFHPTYAEADPLCAPDRAFAMATTTALAMGGTSDDGTRLVCVNLSGQSDTTVEKWEVVGSDLLPTVRVRPKETIREFVLTVSRRQTGSASTGASFCPTYADALERAVDVLKNPLDADGNQVYELSIGYAEAYWVARYWGGPDGALVAIDLPLANADQVDAVRRSSQHCLDRALSELRTTPPSDDLVRTLVTTGINGIGMLSRSVDAARYRGLPDPARATWKAAEAWINSPSPRTHTALVKQLQPLSEGLAQSGTARPDVSGLGA